MCKLAFLVVVVKMAFIKRDHLKRSKDNHYRHGNKESFVGVLVNVVSIYLYTAAVNTSSVKNIDDYRHIFSFISIIHIFPYHGSTLGCPK